jgi:hypothetical protein
MYNEVFLPKTNTSLYPEPTVYFRNLTLLLASSFNITDFLKKKILVYVFYEKLVNIISKFENIYTIYIYIYVVCENEF